MENYIDLTSQEYQGCFGHDAIAALDKPGKYKLPFKYWDGCHVIAKNIVVDVLTIYYVRGGQHIVVADTNYDYHYIFYYNGSEKLFKPNAELGKDYNKVFKWIDQEIESEH